jgi:hypothetical protein
MAGAVKSTKQLAAVHFTVDVKNNGVLDDISIEFD